MGTGEGWTSSWAGHGVLRVELATWRFFYDFVYENLLGSTKYVWRGHRCEGWALEPTLDRELKGMPGLERSFFVKRHLEDFKYAARGRRGPNPRDDLPEKEWWALGQHHGLATPLLDWTKSPFVALYFAFVDAGSPQTPRRSVFALHRDQVEEKSAQIEVSHTGQRPPPIIEFFRPKTSDNPRLVNQGGLFTRAPRGVSVGEWVKTHFREAQAETHEEEDEGLMRELVLMEILIPDQDREACLIALNRMNINHLTLFPDLDGASAFCNKRLTIPEY